MNNAVMRAFLRFQGFARGALFVAAIIAAGAARADRTWEYTVQVSATVETSPPRITLSWPQDQNEIPSSYIVSRKAKSDTAWGPAQTLTGTTLNFTDTNVQVGSAYEYQVKKITSAYRGYGYIFAGIQAAPIEDRGKIVLLVDDTVADPLAAEIARLQQDLTGDGWHVIRHNVSRAATPPTVKSLIRSSYDLDPVNTKSLLLLGRIPVPYSGDLAPDDHFEIQGAWPADLFYADIDGVWTDSTVHTTSAQTQRRWNVPGDGKFDQSFLPSPVELQLGRIDLANMPGRKEWMGSPTFPSEIELLRNYLNKNHRFRHALSTAERRGIVYDGAGSREGAGFAASAWRNFSPMFGAPQIRVAQANEFLPILASESYLWSYANGGADSQNIAYLGGTGNFNGGRTTDFVEMNVRTVFAMLFGSHMGDWDVEDNIMRSVLATPDYGLTCVYAGAPHWFFHHMALGETIGFSTRITQNNPTNDMGNLYWNEVNQSAGMVHVALMGDPTLRMHPVSPPSQLVAVPQTGAIRLTWNASPEPVIGYLVYKAADEAGPFQRLTQTPLQSTEFTHPTASGGVYMVRAIKLEVSASGSYSNLSQGIFAQATAPPLPEGDSDLDGMSDADEIVAGTDPANPASVLRIQRVGNDSNMLTITWSSIPGKRYRVASRDLNSLEEWIDISNELIASGSETSWTSPRPESAHLYRVRVVP